MKNISLIILFIMFFNFISFSQNNILVKAGINNTWFNGNVKDTKSDIQYFVGIGKDWILYKRISFSIELNYLNRSSIVKNKIIAPVSFSPDQKVYLNNINCNIGYIEIPTFIKLYTTFSENFYLDFYFGFIYSIINNDNSKINKEKYLFTLDDNYSGQYAFDYYKSWESGFGNNSSKFIYGLGFELFYKIYGIDLRYTIDTRKNIWIDKISPINKTFSTFFITFIYKIYL